MAFADPGAEGCSVPQKWASIGITLTSRDTHNSRCTYRFCTRFCACPSAGYPRGRHRASRALFVALKLLFFANSQPLGRQSPGQGPRHGVLGTRQGTDECSSVASSGISLGASSGWRTRRRVRRWRTKTPAACFALGSGDGRRGGEVPDPPGNLGRPGGSSRRSRYPLPPTSVDNGERLQGTGVLLAQDEAGAHHTKSLWGARSRLIIDTLYAAPRSTGAVPTG